jgi:uncharacterized membrane protein
MDLAPILVFIHVLAAIMWIGGVIMHLALMGLATRDGDPELQLKLLGLDGRLAPIIYIPGSLLLIITGVAMVLMFGASFGEPWISVGMAVWIISFVIGISFYAPQGKKLGAAVEAGGPASPEAQAIIARMERVTWLQLPLLILAVFAMTTKFTF